MISVIVPVYKSEKTLEKCVKSLCAQTDRDLEILLIVDGPPDDSGILAERLAQTDERIRVINQKNQGVSNARNRGIREARGEYIRFVDSDDYVGADSNEKLLTAMKAQDADMVIAGYHHLYFGRDILKLPKEGCYEMNRLNAQEQEAIRRLYKNGFLNMPWNKLYKKERMEQAFPTDLNLGEDLLFNQAYMEKSRKIVSIACPVCYYIQDDRGTTLSTKKRMDKIPIALRLYEETTAFFEHMGIDDDNMPATKAVMEFLDDMEGLAFAQGMSRKEKMQTIQLYEDALLKLGEPGQHPRLELLDYRLIFMFYRRNRTGIVYFLVQMRGFIARVLKKRG
jgi:glycosyltransferase involved in cell wall biosynthesis